MLLPPASDATSSKRLMTLRRAKPKPQPRHSPPAAAARVLYSRCTAGMVCWFPTTTGHHLHKGLIPEPPINATPSRIDVGDYSTREGKTGDLCHLDVILNLGTLAIRFYLQ
ncbi:hypothetical protein M0R45_035390 [Rubus argutus]|uniref:Uncharacterized protein n=1 Tax=Rubus argutus TaxID=59490 RepID=A0AAW1VXF1_RUBAR